jgi:hypothetical protein
MSAWRMDYHGRWTKKKLARAGGAEKEPQRRVREYESHSALDLVVTNRSMRSLHRPCESPVVSWTEITGHVFSARHGTRKPSLSSSDSLRLFLELLSRWQCTCALVQ